MTSVAFYKVYSPLRHIGKHRAHAIPCFQIGGSHTSKIESRTIYIICAVLVCHDGVVDVRIQAVKLNFMTTFRHIV